MHNLQTREDDLAEYYAELLVSYVSRVYACNIWINMKEYKLAY